MEENTIAPEMTCSSSRGDGVGSCCSCAERHEAACLSSRTKSTRRWTQKDVVCAKRTPVALASRRRPEQSRVTPL